MSELDAVQLVVGAAGQQQSVFASRAMQVEAPNFLPNSMDPLDLLVLISHANPELAPKLY